MFQTTFTTTVTVERHGGFGRADLYYLTFTLPLGQRAGGFATVDDFGNLVPVMGA